MTTNHRNSDTEYDMTLATGRSDAKTPNAMPLKSKQPITRDFWSPQLHINALQDIPPAELMKRFC
jgi:hypothetical protein